MAVTFQAATSGEVLDRIRKQDFDLLVLDTEMPGITGAELIARVHAHVPRLPILAFSVHNEAQVVRRILYAGAAGYLSKDCDPETLLFAIRKIASGGRFIDLKLAERIAFHKKKDESKRPHEQLSNRELCILRLLVAGKTVNDVASQLVISNKTVSTHKARMMEKMGFQSNAEMIRYGIDHALDA
eukprot:XP_002537336.2 uncharacterized protein LOC8269458 [Ricinus communis]